MWSDDQFATLDDIDRDGMTDTPEEWAEFESRLRAEIATRGKNKEKDSRMGRDPHGLSDASWNFPRTTQDEPLFDKTPSSPVAPPASAPTPSDMPPTASAPTPSDLPPSAGPSRWLTVAATSPALLPSRLFAQESERTPPRPTSTLGPAPTVQTPPMPPPLPAPTSASTLVQARTPFDTPVNVPTPTQTPGSVGSRRRDGADTSLPLPADPASELRNRKDLQRLASLHEAFLKKRVPEEQSATTSTRGRGRGRGRGHGASIPPTSRTGSAVGFGGPIFKGLRFIIPSEKKQLNKHKGYWDTIMKHGGSVVLSPDTALTHVIYDPGKTVSAALLARELGISSLSELPEGTVCIKYDWIVQCTLNRKLFDPGPWLSFPPTTLTRAPTRMVDITRQIRGNEGSIKPRWAHTPTDSETESSFSQLRAARGLPPSPDDPLSPVKKRPKLDPPSPDHGVTSGPGWKSAPAGAQDGLDVMITGLLDGSMEDDVSDIETDDESDLGNPNPTANKYKCGQRHNGKKKEPDGPNEWLAKEFDKLHDLYQGDRSKSEFQVRGYQKTAGILRRTMYTIKSGEQARKIKGIGESMALRIDEFLTGAKGRAYYEDTEERRTVAIFKDIYGVGKNFAATLYQRGARTIDDLRTNDYGLSPGQVMGVELYEDLLSRIPREEVAQLYDKIRTTALGLDPKLSVEPMGSYRRGDSSSGDLDILITRDPSADGITHARVLRQLVQSLHRQGVLTHDLSIPHDWYGLEAKWMGVGRVDASSKHRRIDILCIPHEQYGAALLYFTGNAHFNRSMRLYARKKGYSLNQRGLFRGVMRNRKGVKTTEGEVVASRTEREIFDILGIRWREPHHRRP